MESVGVKVVTWCSPINEYGSILAAESYSHRRAVSVTLGKYRTYKHIIDTQLSSLSGALDMAPSTPFPSGTGLTSGTIVPQNRSLLGRDLKNVVSSSPPKKASDKSNITTLELLCFCRVYVVELTISARVVMPSGGKASLKAREDIVGVKLLDYVDQRIYKLQEHVDTKSALLMDSLLSLYSPATGMALSVTLEKGFQMEKDKCSTWTRY
ncbi:unnamed protein product [Nyctereutes procyonoides]|uniref:(raccoon dog) hypothetical protein n=1 Tax=Nyctereutes procyonoides TaxID=34880 RepID=A0A811YTX0_NYCPR|nr:unnamed protein product [Nyctereutes procyonoides]